MGTQRELHEYLEIMTTDDVAELLGYAVTEIRVLARNGRIPAHKEPGSHRWRFERDELIAWLRSEARVTPEAG